MKKKLLIMLGLVLIVVLTLAPSAFAEDPVGSADIAVTQPDQSVQTYVANYDGTTSGNISSSATIQSEITKVDISISGTTDADKVVVTGIDDATAGGITGGGTGETFYAGAKIEVKKETTPGDQSSYDTMTLESGTTVSAGVKVSGSKIDTEQEGLVLYEVDSTNALVEKGYVKDSDIDNSAADKSTVTISMESLYNFMLKKYSKYSSTGDKTLTYTPGSADVLDTDQTTVLTQGQQEKYSIEETINGQKISIEILGKKEDNSASPLDINACFTIPTDGYVSHDLVYNCLKYSDYIFGCKIDMNNGTEALSLDSSYTAKITVETNKIGSNQVIKLYDTLGQSISTDPFTQDNSGNKLVFTKTITNYSDIFDYIIVAENAVEVQLVDQQVGADEKPLKEGTKANYFTISIDDDTTATKATVKVYGNKYVEKKYDNQSYYLGGKFILTDNNGKEPTYNGNSIGLKIFANYFDMASKAIELYEVIDESNSIDRTSDVIGVIANNQENCEISIKATKAYEFIVKLVDKNTTSISIGGASIGSLSNDYTNNDGTIQYRAGSNELILNNYIGDGSLALDGDTRIRVIGSNTIFTDNTAITITNGKINFVGDGKLRLVTSVETTAGIGAVIDDNCYTKTSDVLVIKKDKIGYIIAPDYYFSDIFYEGNVKQYSNGDSKLFITEGIILDTGDGSNRVDQDLSSLLESGQSYGGHTSCYQFTTIAEGTDLNFDYVFSSIEFNQSPTFNDAFGLFVSVNDGAFENLAIFTDKAGNSKTITMNNLRNAEGVSNSDLNGEYCAYDTFVLEGQGNGHTYMLTGAKKVNIGDKITIKFVIADVGDTAYDSFVLIQENSFSFIKTITFNDFNGNTKKLTLDTTSPFPDDSKLSGLNFSTKRGYNFAGWYDVTTGNMLKEKGQDALTSINWASISTVGVKWIPKEVEVTVKVEGTETAKFNWTYDTDFNYYLEYYKATKKGHDTLWRDIPKDGDGNFLDTPFEIECYFEACSYYVTIDFLNGNKQTFKAVYGKNMMDIIALPDKGATYIFGGYTNPVYGQYWDNLGHNIRALDIDHDVTFYAFYYYVNSYTFSKHLYYDSAANEDFVIKYKFNNILSRVTEETLKQIKVIFDGIELDSDKVTILLDANGNVSVIIDKEYLKTFSAGDYYISTYLLNQEFKTKITIS